MSQYSENIIIGAGAAGLFCAAQLAKLGKSVTVFDNGKKIGRKILMSGGGFCNFTNLEVTPQHYLCQNPHFVKSALACYNQWDFIALVAQYGISYHEKELGQLFCDEGAEQIVKLQKPPPDIKILRPIFLPLSNTSTRLPAWPNCAAQNSPAAPAPITITSISCIRNLIPYRLALSSLLIQSMSQFPHRQLKGVQLYHAHSYKFYKVSP